MTPFATALSRFLAGSFLLFLVGTSLPFLTDPVGRGGREAGPPGPPTLHRVSAM